MIVTSAQAVSVTVAADTTAKMPVRRVEKRMLI